MLLTVCGFFYAHWYAWTLCLHLLVSFHITFLSLASTFVLTPSFSCVALSSFFLFFFFFFPPLWMVGNLCSLLCVGSPYIFPCTFNIKWITVLIARQNTTWTLKPFKFYHFPSQLKGYWVQACCPQYSSFVFILDNPSLTFQEVISHKQYCLERDTYDGIFIWSSHLASSQVIHFHLEIPSPLNPSLSSSFSVSLRLASLLSIPYTGDPWKMKELIHI